MFLSIITPTFNSQRVIKKLVESLNDQNLIFEQIIVDNLSKDATLEEIKKNAKYPYKIVLEKDLGIYDAMNKGVKYAQGDFLLFLNSDDWLPKNTLSYVKSVIKKNQGSDIYFGNSKFYNNKKFCFYHKSNLKKILKFNSLSHQAMYYSRSIFKKYKFDISYKIAADYDLTIKLYNEKKSFHFINFNLSNNLLGGKSSNLVKSFEDFSNIQIKYNGIKGYINIFYVYNIKLIIIFLKKLYEKLFS